uniref:Sphingomyelin synthase-like domain-containing protein n=1 Tax=viral metagenome TaxID=1070528 RepID=A0A6C0IF96_9ZZZZ
MYKILIFFIVIIIIFGLNYWCHLIGMDFYKDQPTNYKIHDLLHSVLPDLHDYHISIDIIGFIAVIPAIMYFNQELTIEFLTKFLIIMLIRAFTIVSTVLPKYERCDTKFDYRNFILGGCYDKIFSGHTSFILLLTLLYYREHIINLPTLFVMNIINMLAIIATRSHYTVDVLIAIFVTTTIFNVKI